ncbi:MAG: ribosome small subunit-dependent GTPase A [Actinomycetota bacterium]|nr:ribosome small subunit-dependent GTPase A [Actinomycetota bacterium]
MSTLVHLHDIGWDEDRERELASLPRHLIPGRVVAEHRGASTILTSKGELWAEPTGRLRHEARSRADLPSIGDWVALDERDHAQASIHSVLPRRAHFSRNIAGKATDEQVLAANVDVSFLVASLELDVNLRRLERYLTLAWSGGTDPVIVLAKSDLTGDPEDLVYELQRVESIALGVPLVLTSSITGAGVDDLRDHLVGNRTGVFLGSSGVGKSSLINTLLGRNSQEVKSVRADGKGRHTTTLRELIPLPGGGAMIDTPGLRGLKLWGDGEGIEDAFADVEEAAVGCRFRDCRHEQEPGCAVAAAIEAGELSRARLDDFVKLRRELEWRRAQQDRKLAAKNKKRRRAVEKRNRTISW